MAAIPFPCYRLIFVGLIFFNKIHSLFYPFFYYPPSSGIASCVGTAGTLMLPHYHIIICILLIHFKNVISFIGNLYTHVTINFPTVKVFKRYFNQRSKKISTLSSNLLKLSIFCLILSYLSFFVYQHGNI